MFNRFFRSQEARPVAPESLLPTHRPRLPRAGSTVALPPVSVVREATFTDSLPSSSSRGASSYSDRTIGTTVVRVAHERLTSEASVAMAVSFDRTLTLEIGLASGLYSQICPVEVLPNSKKFALIVTERMATSPEVVEVMRLLAKKQYMLADGLQPNFFICSVESIILSLARGDITGEEVSKRKKVLGNSADGVLWRNFLEIISWGVSQNAADIHFNISDLSQRSQVKFTIDGVYTAPSEFLMPTSLLSQIAQVAYQQSKGGNGAAFQPLTEQQCRIFTELEVVDKQERVMLRWASIATDDGPQITMRALLLDSQSHVQTIQGLGYLPSQCAVFKRASVSEGGAIIASGVLGSGKSTLLAALMGLIPSTQKIYTFEDPREYVISGAHQVTIARDLDSDKGTEFLAKKRSLKRTAVQQFMLGEVRDRETGEIFQDVVESGVSVYTTVHSRRHIGIADRLASPSIGVDRNVLATPGILKLLIGQVLLPLVCQNCAISATDVLSGREKMEGHEDLGHYTRYFKRIESLFDLTPDSIKLRNRLGCSACQRDRLPELSGLKGRIVAAELIEPDDYFLELVRDAKNIELSHYVSSLRTAPLTDPETFGKSALEVALYHMHMGLVDPRSIEPRFEMFETLELRRKQKRSVLLRAAA